MDKIDIADYVVADYVDPLSRVPGVGTSQVFGRKYAMRIWLDPNKPHTYQLSIPEVTAAIRAQNAQLAIGALVAAPALDGQQINATINAHSRLQTPDQFPDTTVRSNPDALGRARCGERVGQAGYISVGAEH